MFAGAEDRWPRLQPGKLHALHVRVGHTEIKKSKYFDPQHKSTQIIVQCE